MAKFADIEGLKPIKVFLSAYAEEPILVYKKEDIDRRTAANVAPVVHAHWVYNRNGMDWNLGAWECSACKRKNNNLPGSEIYSPYSFVGSRYCPNCGAKMDEEEQDE